jgi:hypothetical protein
MSSGKDAESPRPLTTTGGARLGSALLGSRMLTHVVAPITAQKSVADNRRMRAALLHRAQKRSSSAR